MNKKYRGIFEYEYPTEHKPPVSIDVHLHGDCVKGKIIEWEYRPLEQELKTGHWIEDAEQHHVEKTYHCSECGHGVWGEYEKTEYCGGCGAKMVESQESEV